MRGPRTRGWGRVAAVTRRAYPVVAWPATPICCPQATARDLRTLLAEIPEEQAQIAMMRQAFRLIHIADIESVTAIV